MLGTSSMQLTCPHCSKQVIFNRIGLKGLSLITAMSKILFVKPWTVIYDENDTLLTLTKIGWGTFNKLFPPCD